MSITRTWFTLRFTIAWQEPALQLRSSLVLSAKEPFEQAIDRLQSGLCFRKARASVDGTIVPMVTFLTYFIPQETAKNRIV